MPVFEISAPDGGVYQVEGPDEAGALAALRKMSGAAPAAETPAPAFKVRPETQGRDNNLLEIGKDIGRVALGGLTTGAMAIPDMANIARSGFNAALDKVLPPTEQQKAAKAAAPQPIGSPQAVAAVENATGIDTRPEAATTTVGKTIAPYVKTASEFVPMSMATGGGAIVGGILPGIASETAGQLSQGKWYEPIARIAAPMAAAPAIARAVTPLPASAAKQRLVDILNNEGVTSLTAGQKTGSEALRYAESALGNAPGAGGKTNAITREGQEQFTEAAMRRAGGGENAGPESLAANQARLGENFRDISTRNNLQMDPQFGNELGAALRVYDRVPNSQQRAIVQGYADDIIAHAQAGGTMPGPQYQEMRSRLSRQSNSLRESDPTLSETLRDMRDALDGAFARSISPADRDLLTTTRREYGAQKTIEKSVARAGEATAEGQIVPANLRNTVATGNNRGAYARGEGDFSELARAGAGVMSPMPQSGTGPRAAIHAIASLIGAGAGSVGGVGIGSGLGAAAGAVAGPALVGRALMSRPMQAYLANQLATTSGREAVARAILESGGQQSHR